MNIFERIKKSVTARQAAERYGLQVKRNGMACCPFHKDKRPSMKLDERYYCFSCGATGDAVDLTARLLGLNLKEAAQRLAADFEFESCTGIESQKVVRDKMSHTKIPDPAQDPGDEKWADRAARTLTDYLCLLRSWEKDHAPQRIEDQEWHPLFCEALDRKTYIEYVLDELLAADESDYKELRRCFEKEVKQIEERLERYDRRNAG